MIKVSRAALYRLSNSVASSIKAPFFSLQEGRAFGNCNYSLVQLEHL